MTSRVLFILKRRDDYNQHPSYSQHGISTGLLNSASFVSDMLLANGVVSKVAVVIDNNGIDKEVAAFKPDIVVIEALWVVPDKFEVLSKLHPTVTWVVRLHSETPFIASEGIAMKWIQAYLKYPNVVLGINASRFYKDVEEILAAGGYSHKEINKRVWYMPNYYPLQHSHHQGRCLGHYVDVGCFGAVRPLKNHLTQAIAALSFATQMERKLRFHINVGRTEMKGDPILSNLIGLFDGLKDAGHELVVHQWAPHEEFIKIVKSVDIGMQVSFSETFNIVAADMVMANIPIVVSKEVPWAVCGTANPVDSRNMAAALMNAWKWKTFNVMINQWSLRKYVEKSERTWLKLIQHHKTA